eukprot:scaffold49844_cov56-Phaeocystis_antarctica.AAC.2
MAHSNVVKCSMCTRSVGTWLRNAAWYLAGGKEGFFSSAAEAGWTRRADRLGRREAVRLVRRCPPSCEARR